MSFKKHGRQYDLIVFGATGYTGQMTAEHIASQFPTDLKWAIAGRSAEKLQSIAKELQALNPDRPSPEIETCSLNDADLAELAKKTFVLIATVGPYAKYGEYAFKACAESGTHYVDCTGEAVWTLDMIQKYESTAKSTGACMFPQCGIESAPSDLVTYSLASLIRSKLSAPTGDVVVDIHKIHAKPSGGTLASAIGVFETYHWKQVARSHKPYALSPVANTILPPAPSLFFKLTGLVWIPNLGLLARSLTAGTDAAIVMRTWGLTKQDPSLNGLFYGPNFTYREFMKPGNFLTGMLFNWGLTMGGLFLVFCQPFRNLLRKFVRKPGDGPSREECAHDYIEFRGVAKADLERPAAKQALCKAWYTGSMYYLTATFIAQAASTLLEEDVPLKGGIYTPACLGEDYLDRLEEQGFQVETKMIEA
ncbi:hypothetical protein SLS62_004520 [Diatrype stigma]|uniref:Saccharopine dehydrogenase NADP binding domain-containing protein n=1 Tax=Diatrype stigma TaxID=117547 RepID=A0AAN9UWD0_9PEZI